MNSDLKGLAGELLNRIGHRFLLSRKLLVNRPSVAPPTAS